MHLMNTVPPSLSLLTNENMFEIKTFLDKYCDWNWKIFSITIDMFN